jgi:hypothetical protein
MPGTARSLPGIMVTKGLTAQGESIARADIA